MMKHTAKWRRISAFTLTGALLLEIPEVDWLYYNVYGNNCLYSFDPERLTVWLQPAITLPSDYTCIEELELGIIYNFTTANMNINDNQFTAHYNSESKKVFSSFMKQYLNFSNIPDSGTRTYSHNIGIYDFPQEWWDNKETVKFRVYAAIKRGDDIELVLSRILYVQLDPKAE
ncbi:MAG: hypothetical protein NC124_07910 [Clostridium sp.]|nr:hypothetical protein [Clostridium sp.]